MNRFFLYCGFLFGVYGAVAVLGFNAKVAGGSGSTIDRILVGCAGIAFAGFFARLIFNDWKEASAIKSCMTYPFFAHAGSTLVISPIVGKAGAALRVAIDLPSNAKEHDWEFVVIHTNNDVVVQSYSLFVDPANDLSEFNSDVKEELEWSGEILITCKNGPSEKYTSSCSIVCFGYKQKVDLPDIA